MAIKILRFPYLVQRQIFEEMSVLEALSIAMLSKKSHVTARACLSHHKYHLRYIEGDIIQLERKFSEEDGNTLDLVLAGPNLSPQIEPYQLWRIGNQEVPIKSTSTESNGKISTHSQVFSDNLSEFAMETLQYFSNLLPKLSLTLMLKAQNVDTFRKTMKSVESVEEIKEIRVVETVWDRDPVSQDELVKLVLDASQRAKKLCVTIPTSDNFDYPTSVPFKFDSVSVASYDWISSNHFIKLFLSCKKVELHLKNFDDEDLAAIFKAWAEGSPLELLQFIGTTNFYRSKTLNSILEEFPGAAPIRNAMIPTSAFSTSKVVTFGEGECFLIQQNDEQTTALVYIVDESVMLSTNFQIGKEVDEMAARIEEERLLRQQHPLDENMEAEED